MQKSLPRKLVTGFALLIGITVWAAPTTYLVLNLRDGTQNTFALPDKPKVKPGAESLTIECDGLEVNVGYTDLINYAFDVRETQGIDAVESDTQMTITDGIVAITGLKPGALVSAFTPEGIMLHRMAADSNGHAHINLAELGGHVIIINTGKSSFKILNK